MDKFNKQLKLVMGGDLQPLETYTTKSHIQRLKRFLSFYFEHVPQRSINERNLNAIAKYVVSQIPNSNTKNTFFIDTRKVLKTRTSDPHLLAVYSAGKDDFQKRKQAADNSLRDKKPKLVDINDYIQLIHTLYDSKNKYDQLLLVTLCIGSRSSEVLSESKYELVSGSDRDLKVSGFLKARPGTPKSIQKPVIELSPEQLIEVVHNIRIRIPNTPSHSAITETYKKYNMTSQAARDAYSHVSFELYADKERYTLGAWTTKVLGHSDASTSSSYSRTTIVDKSKQNDEKIDI